MWLLVWKAVWILSAASLGADDMPSFGDAHKMTRTLSEILKSYDVRLRPNFGADPLYIGIDLTIASFNEISEVNMDYTVSMFLNQYWKDERLAFSTGDEELTFTGAFTERIWVPDIFFPKDKDSFIHDVTEKNKVVRLFGDGSIMYGMRFTTTQSCQMDLRDYPLDSQNCTVEIESYGYTVRDVVMYWKEEAVLGVEDIQLPQFKISDYQTTDRTENLATGVYQRLSLSFKLQRNFGYFFFQMYLPSILIVMLSWVSFWIHNDATAARVALGITTVLTMTTINNSVRSSLPRISYVKAIDIYLVMCFLFVFAALIEYATVNYIFWERKKRKKPKKKKAALGSLLTAFQLEASPALPAKLGKCFSFGLRKRRKPVPKKAAQCSIEVYAEAEEEGAEEPGAELLDLSLLAVPVLRSRLGRSSSFSGVTAASRAERPALPAAPSASAWRNRAFVRSIRKQARVLEKHLQIPSNVSSVDNFSRLFFPISFLVFNAVYWSVYVNKA